MRDTMALQSSDPSKPVQLVPKMIEELNLLVSVIVYAGLSFSRITKTGRLFRTQEHILANRVAAAAVYETAWIYFILSLVVWVGRLDPNGSGFVLMIGIGGAIALPGEVYLAGSDRRNRLSGPRLYISSVEYDYRHRSLDVVTITVRELIEASARTEDAKTALETLLHRQDSLGDLMRERVSAAESGAQ
jgi:hypothetical protein